MTVSKHSSFPTSDLPRRTFRKIAAAIGKGSRGAIYARHSTELQDSMEDQIHACSEWAAKNGIDVEARHIFSDAAVSGKTTTRPGLDALKEALRDNRVDVVIAFTTSRHYRKSYEAQRFIDEEIHARRKRIVFVSENLDTKDPGSALAISFRGMMDEQQLTSNINSIRLGQSALAEQGKVHNTIPFGYKAVNLENGLLTKRYRPQCSIEIDGLAADWVVRIFRMFADQSMSYAAIARYLRKSDVPPPAKNDRWTNNCVKYLIRRRRYLGDWDYGVKENIFRSAKNYSVQVLRDEGPHRPIFIDRLKIIDTDLFDRANAKADAEVRGANTPGRGRRCRQDKNGRPLVEPLRDLFVCPKHGRLRSGGASGELYYCHACKQLEPLEQTLFSVVNRHVARKRICEVIFKALNDDPVLVKRVIDAADAELKAYVPPDLAEIEKRRQEYEKQSARLRMALDHLSGSEEDSLKLGEIRAARDAVAEDIKRMQSQLKAPPETLSPQELESNLANVTAALAEDTEEDADSNMMLYELFRHVLGDKVELTQGGEAKLKKGYLRASLKLNLGYALAKSGTADLTDLPVIEVDLREPPEAELRADEVKAVFDIHNRVKPVAKQMGKSWCFVEAALKHWHNSRDLPMPPLKGPAAPRRATPKDALYKRVADDVLRGVEAKKPLSQIKDELGISWPTIWKTRKYLESARGIALVDGRVLRKQRRGG